MLIITPGDPEGIGPEIVWKSIRARHRSKRPHAFLCVGARQPFTDLGARLVDVAPAGLSRSSFLRLTHQHRDKPCVFLCSAPGRVDASLAQHRSSQFSLPGFQSGWSIETAVRLIQHGVGAALVTGPISKERLNAGGYRFPGHTEFLAKLCKKRSVTMMLANDVLRVSLVTTHLPLNRVSSQLTRREISRAVEHTVQFLKNHCGIKRPKIAVSALNPHAGEGGLLGHEERETIIPALRSLKARLGSSAQLDGPLSADTLFAEHLARPRSRRWDAVVCMYHDQGLIPVKLIDFKHTINITLGLPIIRTSVDHGVAFHLRGTGRADSSSLDSAIDLALSLSVKKKDRNSSL